MLIPLGLLRLRDEQSRAWKILTLLALGCATAGAFLAFSRSAIVAAGMVVLFAAWKRYVSRTKVMVAFAVAVLALLATPEYSTRMASLLNLREMLTAGRHSEADGALKGRATEMGAAALVFIDHPLVGVGPGMFKYYSRDYGERIGLRALAPERQAHCLPLDVAAENGLLGLICLVGVFGAVSVRLMRIIDRNGAGSSRSGLPLAYLLMVAVYFASGLFLHFAFIRYFWLMIALADATVLVCEQRDVECRVPHRSIA
ncbi:MAG: O-antigen ligase family protein [Maioricimonas sp. JB049]